MEFSFLQLKIASEDLHDKFSNGDIDVFGFVKNYIKVRVDRGELVAKKQILVSTHG